MKTKFIILVLLVFSFSGEILLAVDQPVTIKGYLDGVNGSMGSVFGWALDSTKLSVPLDVEFYIDDQKGPNKEVLVGSVKADKAREGLVKAGFTANHGFDYALPLKYKDGKQHRIHAYAISKEKTKTYYELTGSPTVFTAVPDKK